MEYLDVLDESGEKIGLVKTRSEVHRDGDWHGAVHVWIVNSKGELLLQRRSPAKDNNPNLWGGTAAGHIASGDSAEITAVRELKEELGITVHPEELEHLFTVSQQASRPGYINNEVNYVYLIMQDVDLNSVTLQKEEVSEMGYTPFLELEKRVAERDTSIVIHEKEYPLLFEILHQRFDT